LATWRVGGQLESACRGWSVVLPDRFRGADPPPLLCLRELAGRPFSNFKLS
jgi:hypothetical protein